MKIKEMAASERPREKLIKEGARFLSNSELLGVVIGSGSRGSTAIDLASEILNSDSSGLQFLAQASCEELMRFPGIGEATACRIAASMELAKRLSAMRAADAAIESPRAVADMLMERLRYFPEEHFLTVLLNVRCQVMSVEEIAVGGAASVSISPANVFMPAVKKGAAGVILAHNHPSGDPKPSGDDMSLTDRLAEAGRILGIGVVDHIVIGNGNYYSFKDKGLIL